MNGITEMNGMNWHHLKNLCGLDGVSGHEEAIRDYILKALKNSPAEMEITVDPLGSVIACVKGEKRASRRLLIAAHMDEVGLLVTGITEEGYLRFTTVGGLDARVVCGHRVKINGHSGVVGLKAVHQCKGEEKNEAPAMDKLLIDIGARSREEAEQMVKPGDAVSFDADYVELENGLFKAKALDDRAGCALLLELASHIPPCDVVLAFTVQEEVGLRGAKAVAYSVQPDIAVVVDATTAADTSGVPADKQVCHVGDGPVVSFMDKRTLYDHALYLAVRAHADKLGIPNQTKTVVAGGNDAGAIQLERGGVRVAAVSLPCRYIHSPACVLAKQDVENTLHLLESLVPLLGEAAL